MESAIVLSTDDVKHIIAKYFGVEQSKVIKSQYTYTVIGARAQEIFAIQEGNAK